MKILLATLLALMAVSAYAVPLRADQATSIGQTQSPLPSEEDKDKDKDKDTDKKGD